MNSGVLFWDTETSGKADFKKAAEDPAQPHLVQLAAMLATREHILAQINFIVRPDGWEIMPEVSAIHGIDQAMALKYGVPRRVALANFNQLCRLSGRLVAHNIDFDKLIMLSSFFREEQTHHMADLQHICTMHAATPILKLPSAWKRAKDPYKWPTLTEVHKHYFGVGFDGAHNAMRDVEALAKIYWRLEDDGAIPKAA